MDYSGGFSLSFREYNVDHFAGRRDGLDGFKVVAHDC